MVFRLREAFHSCFKLLMRTENNIVEVVVQRMKKVRICRRNIYIYIRRI